MRCVDCGDDTVLYRLCTHCAKVRDLEAATKSGAGGSPVTLPVQLSP